MKQAWAVIPAHNEASRVGRVIREVKYYVPHAVVVDDGSNDNTYDTAKREGASVLRHVINLGKGAALKTGCDFAVKQGAEIIIAIDADGQHEPKEIPNFLNALRGKDIVFGYRKLSGQMPVVFRFGNWLINKAVELLFGIRLRDTQCGYRVFTADAYKAVRWRSGDYFVESEMIANAGRRHLKYAEVPINTIYADKYKGTTVLDGIKIVFNLFMWRLK